MTTLEQRILQDTIQYQQIPILNYHISYPYLTRGCNCHAICYINNYYQTNACAFENFCRNDLAKEAMAAQKEHGNFSTSPMPPFEALDTFQVTFMDSCIMSLYYDRYLFTGGAHGNTTRYADTWELETGRRISLWEVLPPACNEELLTETIASWIDSYITSNPDQTTYFDEPYKNVKESFAPAQFYLTCEGPVIYFQQYQIGPYSSGILEFRMKC